MNSLHSVQDVIDDLEKYGRLGTGGKVPEEIVRYLLLNQYFITLCIDRVIRMSKAERVALRERHGELHEEICSDAFFKDYFITFSKCLKDPVSFYMGDDWLSKDDVIRLRRVLRYAKYLDIPVLGRLFRNP